MQGYDDELATQLLVLSQLLHHAGDHLDAGQEHQDGA